MPAKVTMHSNRHDHMEFLQDARVGLPTLKTIIHVLVREIIYCQGHSSQTTIFFFFFQKILISRTLGQCEFLLEGYGFCRIHKSYLVNLEHIKEYYKTEENLVLLSDGTRLDVSKSYKDMVKLKLNCL